MKTVKIRRIKSDSIARFFLLGFTGLDSSFHGALARSDRIQGKNCAGPDAGVLQISERLSRAAAARHAPKRPRFGPASLLKTPYGYWEPMSISCT